MSMTIDRTVFDAMTQKYLEERAAAAAADLTARMGFPARAEGATVIIGPQGVLQEFGSPETPGKPWVNGWLAGLKG